MRQTPVNNVVGILYYCPCSFYFRSSGRECFEGTYLMRLDGNRRDPTKTISVTFRHKKKTETLLSPSDPPVVGVDVVLSYSSRSFLFVVSLRLSLSVLSSDPRIGSPGSRRWRGSKEGRVDVLGCLGWVKGKKINLKRVNVGFPETD